MKRHFAFLFTALCGLVLLASPAYAQFSGLGIDQMLPGLSSFTPGSGLMNAGPTLYATPSYPEPGTPFKITVEAPGGDTAGAIITWYLNGTEVSVAKNKREYTFTAGPVGSAMNVRVELSQTNGQQQTLTTSVIPAYIDIIIEGYTTVPDFYRGRAVPSGGTQARATAIVDIGRPLNQAALSYRWELNNEVIDGGTIRGLQSAEFTMPRFRESWLKIGVFEGANLIAERTIPLEAREPEILFYEKNPLYGVRGRALVDSHTVSGNQATIIAAPYNLPPLGSGSNQIEWRISGQRRDTSKEPEPLTAILRGSGSESAAPVFVKIFNPETGVDVYNSFDLRFGF